MKKRNLLCIFLISLSLVGCGADTATVSDPTPSTEDVATEVTTSMEDEEKLGLDAIKNEKERTLIEESMNKPQPAKSTTTKNKNKNETVEEEDKTSETVKETEKKETTQKEETKEVVNTTTTETTVNNTPTPTEQPQTQPQTSEPAPSAPTSTEHVHTWVKTQIGTTSVQSDEIIGYDHVQIHGDEYAPIFDDMGRVIGQTLVSPAEYTDIPIYGSRNEPIYANVCSTCGASQ